MSTYPSPPGPRLRYDRDGTVGLYQTGPSVLPAGNVRACNGEAGGGGPHYYSFISTLVPDMTFFFPELRDIVGLWGSWSGSPLGNWGYSTDTTNGSDGNWTLGTYNVPGQFGGPGRYNFGNYRNSWIDASAGYGLPYLGIRGFRVYNTNDGAGSSTGGWDLLHLYGYPSAGQTLDKLVAWDPDIDQRAGGATLDYHDIQRGANAVVQRFRVKNLSTKTARSIQVSVDTPITDTNPSQLGIKYLSVDNSYYPTNGVVTIPDIPPGGISGVIYVRNTMPANAQLGEDAGCIIAQAAAFS